MKTLNCLLNSVDAVNKWVGNMVNWLILPIALLTIYEVVSRFVFNEPTTWAHDIAAHLFGFFLIMLGASILRARKHIRVDILWGRLSPRGQAIADLITGFCGLFFIVALLVSALPWAWDSLMIQEKSIRAFRAPLYPLKLSIVLGSFLLLLQFLSNSVRDLLLATKKTGSKEHA